MLDYRDSSDLPNLKKKLSSKIDSDCLKTTFKHFMKKKKNFLKFGLSLFQLVEVNKTLNFEAFVFKITLPLSLPCVINSSNLAFN